MAFRHATIGIMLVLVLAGCCSQSVDLGSPVDFNQLNRHLEGKSPTIVLKNGKHLQARDVIVGTHDVSWADHQGGERHSVPLSEVDSVMVKHRARTGFHGFLLGAGMGGLMALAADPSEREFAVIVAPPLCGLLCAVAGASMGCESYSISLGGGRGGEMDLEQSEEVRVGPTVQQDSASVTPPN